MIFAKCQKLEVEESNSNSAILISSKLIVGKNMTIYEKETYVALENCNILFIEGCKQSKNANQFYEFIKIRMYHGS